MVTLDDIAKKVGISKSTVSKALNHASDISEDTRKKILAAAAELGYTTRNGKNRKRIAVFITNMSYETPNQFGYDIIQGFKEMALKEDWLVTVIPITMEFQKITPYGVYMMEHGYAAGFFLGLTLMDPWMLEFPAALVPTVLYDNEVKGNPLVASVAYDNEEAFLLSVGYLKKLGHKKIGLLSGPLDSFIIKKRYHAYLNAMEAHSLEVDDSYIGLGYYVGESAQTYIPRFIKAGITAVLFSHDVRAIAAIDECRKHNIVVGKDMSFIGFDDLPLAEQTCPPLTTIRQDRTAIGKCSFYAIHCLINRIPIGSILLRPSLIIRESCCPPG